MSKQLPALQRTPIIRPGITCDRCGRANYRGVCPARNTLCYSCGCWDHYAKVYRASKNIQHLGEAPETLDANLDFMVGHVGEFFICLASPYNPFRVKVEVRELFSTIDFVIDTGADITCLPAEVLGSTKIVLTKCTNVVCGPDDRALEVAGFLKLTFCYKGQEKKVDVHFIKKTIFNPLLRTQSHYWML
ncbi:hypothetical protein PR048_009880 [Dryococelus australis]|uniref:Peptidase A2 domain-containing protein n=1 Tax=Dryococelus australis TaxID=614101 RepID=A0ABQ9I152_9NEOP|nr:hypothetical protein PR048_009880 [Dryococelus australis]